VSEERQTGDQGGGEGIVQRVMHTRPFVFASTGARLVETGSGALHDARHSGPLLGDHSTKYFVDGETPDSDDGR